MTLSNGQTRRARLARAMLAKPEVLVLDDPFVGLDAAARADLSALLGELVRDGKRVVLICREDAVPGWVTSTLRMRGAEHAAGTEAAGPATPRPNAPAVGPSDPVIALTDVTVAHAGHTILDRVSWTVRGGERWALLGPNGSGKTTLLSLLCGDHPQAYANDVRLFGRRRGTGETIWDVKRNVGLLSPEFHLYFRAPLAADRAAATGYFDALTDRPTTAEQDDRVRTLFAAFSIGHLAGRGFKTLSTGEQRLVATAAARCRDYIDRELGADQALLFVTHDPAELPDCVSKTLRLERGRVVELTEAGSE
jgi:molybdate transport system ATP-binding protein